MDAIDDVLAVETTIDSFALDHLAPQITYSGLGGMMHVVYVTKGQNFFGHKYDDIKVRNLWYDGYSTYGVSTALTVTTGTQDQELESPATAGSHNGRSLVAWAEEYIPIPFRPEGSAETTDWDIFAQRIAPYWVQLPVMMDE